MRDSYSGALWRSLVVSLVLLSSFTFGGQDPLLTVVSAVFPLVYYHLFYLRPKAKEGLSQNAIDSVYYFGFLITIASLGLAAMSATSKNGSDLRAIGFQFGCGLLATGYAVFARVHLTALSSTAEQANQEEAMLQIVRRAYELGTAVETAIERYGQLSEAVLQRTEQVATQARLQTEKSILEATHAFQEELAKTWDQSRQSVMELKSILSESSMSTEREKFRRSIKSATASIELLSEGLSKIATSADSGQSAIRAVAESTQVLQTAFVTVRREIHKIVAEGGVCDQASSALLQTSKSLRESSAATEAALGKLAASAVAFEQAAPSFAKFPEAGKGLTASLDALAIASGSLIEALRPMTGVRSSSAEFARLMTQSSDVMLQFLSATSAVSARLNTIPQALGNAHTAISEFGDLSRAFAAQQERDREVLRTEAGGSRIAGQEASFLANSIKELNRVIADSTRNIENDTAQTLAAINKLTEGIANLTRTVNRPAQGVSNEAQSF